MPDAPSHFQTAFSKKANARNAGVAGKIVDVLTNSWLVVGSCVVIVLALELLG